MKKKGTGKKILSLVLTFCMMIGALPVTTFADEVTESDAAAPVDVETTSTEYSRINVQGTESSYYELTQAEFAAKSLTVELVYNADISSGDIVVNAAGAADTYGAEGYGITVDAAAGTVAVSSAAAKGAFYGLQDVLAQLEKGSVSDVAVTQPFKGTRSLFVDCARKYFSVDWFEDIIREMAWNGMNTLYISFSNDEGFRLLLDDMSLSFDDGNGATVTYDHEFMAHLVDNPEEVSDSAFLTERNANATDEGNSRVVTNYDNNKYLTQSEMETILAYAKAYGISVVPELNSPGHIGQVMWYFPEYRIQGTWYSDGQPHYGLDLTNTEAANFGTALVKKYVDFFAEQGCKAFCVGGDEYSAGNATNEQISAYTNGLVEYVESKGMTAYAWNDGQAAANGLLKSSAIVNCWNGNNDVYSSINMNSSYLYYVLKGYTWKPDAQTLFESWTPLTYSGNTTVSSDKSTGASLAIWCDVPNNETTAYVLKSMIPNIQAFGYRMWNFSETATTSLSDEYASYSEFAAAVTAAPEIAEATVLATVDYEVTDDSGSTGDSGSEDEGTDDTTLPEPSAGEGYELVTFGAPTVSSSDGWYSDGANLIDGSTNTYAWTNGDQSVGDYMRVDLGKVQTVNTVTVTSPAGSDVCTNANIQVSTDGTNWTTVGTHSGNNSNSVSNTYDVNEDIRYIQIVITEYKSNWWQVAEIAWTPNSTSEASVEDGTYIIVNDTDKAMTTTGSGSGTGLAKQQVTIEDTIATPVNNNYEWTFEKQSDGTYYITDSDGRYLNISSSGISTSTTSQRITVTIFGGKVQLSNGDYAVNYYANSDKIFSWWKTDISDSNNLQTLYKKLTSNGLTTLELYNAIIKAQGYSNDNGKYGTDEFATLQTVLEESITLYKNASAEGTTVTQEEIDAQTEALEAAIAALEISDTSLDYIEIPIEILDFRADGVMFEYGQNIAGKGLYELLTDNKFGNLTYGGVTVAMPGTTGDRLTNDEWNGWNDTCKRTGLVEEYLVNGNPVYKEATVDYVAKLIAKGYFTDLSESATNWNSNISAKITTLYNGYSSYTDTNSNLGTWAETLAKTSTQANGGDMVWSSVTTCYDLAYYILNNMWRSTEAADGEDAYNKTVDNRTILRMLAGDDGYYYLDSTKDITYNGNYIYNTDLTTANTAETKFAPINDLGYESSDDYGDTTDTASGINYHFTLHANGAFVYNADDNLYFYFDGDDDVYFYINGQLVMDLGGAHSHCDDELYLNDVADALGLVDGGIYTFDMFYAERHTTQANLEFRTNIKIMDTMSTTSKGQYNASTGEAISYGAIVDEDTTVAYSFDLLNLRSINVTDISFNDPSLGSYISGESITLYDETKTNGATTAITDMIVYYHTYDRPAPSQPGTLNTSTPAVKTVAEITELINSANANNDSLAQGSYQVNISSEEDLKALLKLGVPIDVQISVYGVKRNVTSEDRPYVNTVTSRAYYVSNGKKIALNGIASQKLTVLNSFSQTADREQIVIDYGKSVKVDLANVKDNIYLNDGVSAEFYGITYNGQHNQIRTSVSNVTTALDTAYTAAASNGTYYLRGNSGAATHIEFKLAQFLSEVEKGYAIYKITDTALADTDYATYYLFIEVDIIPATIMYYETDFADNIFTMTTTGSAWGETTVDGDTVADDPQDDGTIGQNLYGYDSSYANDKYLSNGSSYKVEGQGIKLNESTTNYTQAQFSFTGTGFDIISRTGVNQGAIRVDIYSDAARTNRLKSITVLNKSESGLELYQIPVVSAEMDSYGTYYVTIGVNAAYTNTTYPALNRGGEFFFDAVRVYNPVSSTDSNITLVNNAYVADGEANAEIKEVRNILIDDEESLDGTETGTEDEGVVFVDRYSETDAEGNITETGVGLAEYTAIGPNNEVYLVGTQAIGFGVKVDLTNLPTSIDIGAKSVHGETVTMNVSVFVGDNDEASVSFEKEINSGTAQFCDLLNNNALSGLLGEEDTIYVMIDNKGEGILSITDLKIAYGNGGSKARIIANDTVLAKTVETVEERLNAEEEADNYDILSAEFTKQKVKRKTNVTLEVTTSDAVESLKVQNSAGREQKITVKSVVSEDGIKTWKVQFKVSSTGTQTYTVTGYGADGSSGASADATIKVTR